MKLVKLIITQTLGSPWIIRILNLDFNMWVSLSYGSPVYLLALFIVFLEHIYNFIGPNFLNFVIYELVWFRDSNISYDLQYLKLTGIPYLFWRTENFDSCMQMFGPAGIHCMVALGIGREANCCTAQLLFSTLSFLSFSLPVLPLRLVSSRGISSGLSFHSLCPHLTVPYSIWYDYIWWDFF